MRKQHFDSFPGSRIYFTEGDASCQELYAMRPGELDVKLKFWLLSADHLILSTGHMLESTWTFNWLDRSPGVKELAAELAIVPSLRNDRRNIQGYVTEAPEEEDKPTLLKGRRSIMLERAKRLDEIFETAITWSPQKESAWFRDSIHADLMDAQSPLRRRLRGVSRQSVMNLASAVANCDFLTRERLFELARRHCPRRVPTVRRFGDLYYYMSGARYKDALPVLHDDATALCREAVRYEGTSAAPDHVPSEFWREIASAWGITSELLRSAPLDLIASLRRDSVGRRVRAKWKELIDLAAAGRSWVEPLATFNSCKSELVKLLHSEMNRQRDRLDSWNKGRHHIEGINWVTSGGATVAGYLLGAECVGAASGVLSFMLGRRIIDYAESRLPRVELALLAARLESGITQSR